MAAPTVEEGAPLLLDEPNADFDVLSLTTSSSDSFSLCLSPPESNSLTPSPADSPQSSSPLSGSPPLPVAHAGPASPRVSPSVQPAFAQWSTPLASPCQPSQQEQQRQHGDGVEQAMLQGQLVFELEDDRLIQSDLTSSLSLQPADVAIVNALDAASCRHEEQQEEYSLAEMDDEELQRDGDSDCSDVSWTFSDLLTLSTSLPSTSGRRNPLSLSPLPSSLPDCHPPCRASSTIVVQWLRFHAFPATAIQRLTGYTCSDLFALTKQDAKELLGVAEGIKLYHRVQACKQRVNTARNHSRRLASLNVFDEYDSKYSDQSSDSSGLGSSVASSPQLVPPSAFASAFQQRAPAARLHQLTAAAAMQRCGVADCCVGGAVVRSSPRRGLGWCCLECGCRLCGVHACKSLWTSVVYCPRCYAGESAWVGGMCVIA